ncbi:hypothetical protein [Variovorax sp. PBL-E5]|uniref:hypothetical protein n=1 Tax=Variovorax sp. PBL-E5 TaxID=434014 RepID=UPI0013178193|nr:hypothetical protein [Variovorax sp. PBL-E5]VTU20349.1 hypothetical protein E5CHR_00968 [Variovorax sp. PBL-E5]
MDRLIALHDMVERSRDALVEARADLIEALGDHLCGGGSAPHRAHVDALQKLREAHHEAELRHAAYVKVLGADIVERAQRARA